MKGPIVGKDWGRGLSLLEISISVMLLFSGFGCRLQQKGSDRTSPPPSINENTQPSESESTQKVHPDQGGIIDGNGGELIVTERNPWFVNDNEVPYCIQRSSDFSASAAATSSAIKGAFAQWKEIFTKLGPMNSYDDYKMLGGPGTLSLTINFKEVGCNDNPPLTFKLGIYEKTVDDALRFSAIRTIGFALRTTYDVNTGKAEGFIWLPPDQGSKKYGGPSKVEKFWSESHNLHNILMHEIGHVLGFSHIAGTFMDAKFPALVIEHGFAHSWQGQDLLSTTVIDGKFCGKSLGSDENVFKELWGVVEADLEICVENRNDLKGDDENTPILLELKHKDKTLGSQRISIVGVWTDLLRLGGHYLAKDNGGSYRYKQVTFMYLNTRGLSRGSFKKDSVTKFIEVEMPSPGYLLLRFATGDNWKAAAAVAHEIGGSSGMLDLANLLSSGD